MTDDEFKNLEHAVGRHDGELDTLLTRIQELEEDLRIVIKFCGTNIVELARQNAQGGITQSHWTNPPPYTPAFREQCSRFFEKYRSDR
jgi:hypothetical protein